MKTISIFCYCILFFSQTLAASIPVIGLDPDISIGDSIDLESGHIIPNCLSGEVEIIEEPAVDTYVDVPLTSQLSQSSLVFEFSTNPRISPIITHSFASHSDLANQMSFVFGIRRGLVKKTMKLDQISSCGDLILKSSVYGAEFYVKIDVTFFNFNQASQFRDFFPSSTSLYTFIDDLKSVDDYVESSYRLTLSFFQTGGDRQGYQNLIKAINPKLLLGIQPTELTILRKDLKSIEEYILGPHGIRSQLYDPDGSIHVENLGQIAAFFSPKSNVSPNVFETWQSNLQRYKVMHASLSLRSKSYSEILNLGQFASSNKQIRSLKGELDRFILQLNALMSECSRGWVNCPSPNELASTYDQLLESSQWHASFIDYCRSSYLTGEQFRFKLVLQKISSLDDCFDMNEWLQEQISLDLHAQDLVDLSLIRNLQSLENLDLSFNQISDASAIATFPALRSLNLRNNKLQKIDLRPLEELHRLNLMQNQISLTENLQLPNQLSQLNVIDNPLVHDLSFKTPSIDVVYRHPSDLCFSYLNLLLQEDKISPREFNIGLHQLSIPIFEKNLIQRWEKCIAGYRLLSEFEADFLMKH